MRYPFVLVAAMVIGLGCGKSSKDAHEGHEAAEAEHAEGPARVGPGLAVEAYEVEEGRIKLSEKAVRRLGLRMEKAQFREGAVRVPPQALGEEEGEPFVYVQEPEGWLKRVYVTIGPGTVSGTPILSGLAPGTVLVTQGASFVRLAELDLLAGDAVAACCAI